MYHPTTRVLTVLELLQSHRQLGGPELARRLEVDIRTGRRYITMLQELGIPVQTIRGRYGAYRLRPGFKLPPLMFTDDEALAMTLGLLAARRLGFALSGPAVWGALAKVERVLPEGLRERVQAVQETLVLAPGVEECVEAQGDMLREALLTLSAAVRQRQRVWLRYRAWDGQESERTLDPYGLVSRAGRWYVAGHCHLRHDIRVFRLDRMLEVEAREETFVRPEDFDSLAAVERGIANVPQEWKAEALLEMTLEEARARVPAVLGTLEEAPGGVMLRCWVAELGRLAHCLVGLGCPFTVCRPLELRDALRRLAARATQAAEG